MSMIHPQIRALRAEADALDVEAELLRLEAPDDPSVICRGLLAMARAKRAAAEALLKQESDMLERIAQR